MSLTHIVAFGGAVLMAISAPALAHGPTAKAAPHTILPASARGAAATVDAFHAALRRGDARSAASLVADDAVIFEEGGAERSKAEYSAHHLPADAEFSKLVTSTVIRRTGGANDTLAWITSEGRMTGAFNGRVLDRATTETMVLRRSGGVWKITHIHWSSAAKR